MFICVNKKINEREGIYSLHKVKSGFFKNAPNSILALNSWEVLGGIRFQSNFCSVDTSEVTHLLNCFVVGSLEDMISEYRPDSLMIVGCCSLPMGSVITTPSFCNLSSASTCLESASFVLLYPSRSATSLPTNQD